MLGNKEVMARNIQYFLNKTGMTQAELAEKLGVNKSTISTWIAAKKYPRIDKIEIMANLFKVNKSDLVEYKDHDKRHDYIIFDNGKQIDLSDLPVSVREDIEEYVAFLRLKYKKNKEE